MSTVADIISKIPVLQELEPDQAARLFSHRRFEAGEVIHKEGERRDMLVLIQSGSVEILQIREGRPSVPLITYGPGDALGEGVLLGESSYFTTAVAKTNVESLAADGEKLCEMLDADIELKTRIYGRVINSLLMRLTRVAARDTPETLELLSGDNRTEKDLIGEKDVPSDAYFGIQTARALENFQITGVPISLYPDFIAAFGMVKIAAAKANCDCGVISKKICDAIVAASHEIVQGKLLEQFSVDVIQGGAGTSTNMNINEVIANRALEIMGYEKGDYQHCMPNDHCNASQSTNDSYPTALKLSMLISNQRLVAELQELVTAFREKATEFEQILKMGRTHLQDAVPMSLGQEFIATSDSYCGRLRTSRDISSG